MGLPYADQLSPLAPPQLIGSPMAFSRSVWVIIHGYREWDTPDPCLRWRHLTALFVAPVPDCRLQAAASLRPHVAQRPCRFGLALLLGLLGARGGE